jgi:hypothetical protein
MGKDRDKRRDDMPTDFTTNQLSAIATSFRWVSAPSFDEYSILTDSVIIRSENRHFRIESASSTGLLHPLITA